MAEAAQDTLPLIVGGDLVIDFDRLGFELVALLARQIGRARLGRDFGLLPAIGRASTVSASCG